MPQRKKHRKMDILGTDQNKQASLLHKCFFRKELQGGAYLKERERENSKLITLLTQLAVHLKPVIALRLYISFHTTFVLKQDYCDRQ